MSISDSIAGEVVKGVGKLGADIVKAPFHEIKTVVSPEKQKQTDLKELQKQEAQAKQTIPDVRSIIKQQEEERALMVQEQKQKALLAQEGGAKEVKKSNQPVPIPAGQSKKPSLFTGKQNVKASDQLYQQG
jgi:hypothetical protein